MGSSYIFFLCSYRRSFSTLHTLLTPPSDVQKEFRAMTKQEHLDWAIPRLPRYNNAKSGGYMMLSDFLWSEWKVFYGLFSEDLVAPDLSTLNGYVLWRAYGAQLVNGVMKHAVSYQYFRPTVSTKSKRARAGPGIISKGCLLGPPPIKRPTPTVRAVARAPTPPAPTVVAVPGAPTLSSVAIAKPVLRPARFEPFDDPVDPSNLSLRPANLDEFIEHCTADAAARKASAAKLSGALDTIPTAPSKGSRLSKIDRSLDLDSPFDLEMNRDYLPPPFPSPIMDSPRAIFTPSPQSSPGVTRALTESSILLQDTASFIKDTLTSIPSAASSSISSISSSTSSSGIAKSASHSMVTRHKGKDRTAILAAASSSRLAREEVKRRQAADQNINSECARIS
ncbi:hypothetical protein BDZ89DRAFT_1140446 [Hymenopellis radicata]|nr:hypothetical protein BDZ89DRAFT_1140446 [Hymenopellis radicata]